MNNQSYEEYIRSIIGYPMNNTYACNSCENNFSYSNMENTNDEEMIRLCYPKIYRLINPMVQKICAENISPINETVITQMTNQIYLAVEGNNEINLNINLENNVRGESNDAQVKNENREMVEENRQMRPRNMLLQDLIRILIINELLRRPNRPNRPRPPFPFPGGRPPMRPRSMDYYEPNFYNNLYEY